MGEDPAAGMPVGRRSTSPGRTIGEGEFGLLTSPYKVSNMLLPSSSFNFSPFSAPGA